MTATTFNAFVVAIGWVVGFLLLWRLPRLHPTQSSASSRPARPDHDGTLVSVIIPARDEENSLPNLLASLRHQTIPAGEIIVVDDHSTDQTASLAVADPAVTLVSAAPLPDGWCGKNWACWTGSRRASGALLLFLDADVVLDPSAIATLLATYDENPGLVSVQPHHHVRRPYEWASMVFNILAVMALGIASARPTRRPRAAFGPCILMTRSIYDAVGGHQAVASEVVEDMAIGERVADAGHSVTLLGGGSTICFRMYPDGFRQLLEGWTKNIATGARRSPPLRALLAALWVTAALSSVRYPVDGLTAGEHEAWAVIVPVAFILQMAALSRAVGSFPPVSWILYPLWFLVFVGVFLASLVSTHVAHRVSWRGRSIPLPPRHAANPLP